MELISAEYNNNIKSGPYNLVHKDFYNAMRPQEYKKNHFTMPIEVVSLALRSTSMDDLEFRRAILGEITDSNALYLLSIEVAKLGRQDLALVASLRSHQYGSLEKDKLIATANSLELFQLTSMKIVFLCWCISFHGEEKPFLDLLGDSLLNQRDAKGSTFIFNIIKKQRRIIKSEVTKLAELSRSSHNYDDAIMWFTYNLVENPDDIFTKQCLSEARTHICDWTGGNAEANFKKTVLLNNRSVGLLNSLSWVDNPKVHFQQIKKFPPIRKKNSQLTTSPHTNLKCRRLRIGYLSSDLRDHPVMRLISGIFRTHDQSSFEIFVYSHGPNDDNKEVNDINNYIENFHDVFNRSDVEVISLIGSHNLDILIDLNGCTAGQRPAIFAERLAPTQIHYLGFPSTIGGNVFDYIIADSTVIPKSERMFYSEKIIFLPHTYFPRDDKNHIISNNTTTSRADVGLPDHAFVFCCFNNNYKITSVEFNIWMRAILAVENSVLWLIKSNEIAKNNLCVEAEKRGVDPSRIVFADKVPNAEHLARHRHADLFIDTFNYNAHTTASDALFAGLPVVTKQGRQFSARVASSLLNAAHLPELITTSESDYESLIINLALHPEKLKIIRDKLKNNITDTPVFNTEKFTLHFEAALKSSFDALNSGRSPLDIFVENQNI
jgi:predicted O-linked N-acetylglucosamine transferase (SPINDLY family)